MSEFTLDPRLDHDSFYIMDLELCQLRLMNNQDYKWLILIPKISNIIHYTDLTIAQQQKLSLEINQIATILQKLYQPDRLNIAALGNIVKQMHWHIICRYHHDQYWPDPIWGRECKHYADQQERPIISQIINEISIC